MPFFQVSDIKRMNGLMTDLQMFGRKTLRIPLPGRHSLSWSPYYNPRFQTSKHTIRLGKHLHPSPKSSTGSKELSNVKEKRPVTSAMGLLRGYYGLSSNRLGDEGTEMAVYKSDNDYHSEEEPFSPQRGTGHGFENRLGSEGDAALHQLATSSGSANDSYSAQLEGCYILDDPKASASVEHRGKPRSMLSRMEASGDAIGVTEADRANERLVRRRAKGEGGSTGLDHLLEASAAADAGMGPGRSTAPRPKVMSRICIEQETSNPLSRQVDVPVWNSSSEHPGHVTGNTRVSNTALLGGKSVEGFISKIRRSASNPSLPEERKPFQTSPFRGKGDLLGIPSASQGSSQSGVISSVLEGFPKAGTSRRNKAALD